MSSTDYNGILSCYEKDTRQQTVVTKTALERNGIFNTATLIKVNAMIVF